MKQLILAIFLIAFPVALFSGYQVYSSSHTPLRTVGLGDLSYLSTIVGDAQALVGQGDMIGAARRMTDFESAWDQAETAIRPLNSAQWGNIDDAADTALHAVRSASPKVDSVTAALATLTAELNDPSRTP